MIVRKRDGTANFIITTLANRAYKNAIIIQKNVVLGADPTQF